MIRVTVTSNVGRHTAKALGALDKLMPKALKIAEAAAAEELATKTYQDRTRRLRENTKATLEGTPDNWTIHLDMGAAEVMYGVYVQARGFSNFDQIAIGAAMDIDALIRRSVG
jgi:hypothetical protein